MLKNKLKNNLILTGKVFLMSLLMLANVQIVLAQNTSAPSADCAKDPTGRNCFASFNVKTFLTTDAGATGKQEQSYLASSNPVAAFILQAINFISLTAASLSFLAVVVAGFLMMSAAGNENQYNKGKDILTRALVGLALTLSSYFIVSFVQNLFFETAPK